MLNRWDFLKTGFYEGIKDGFQAVSGVEQADYISRRMWLVGIMHLTWVCPGSIPSPAVPIRPCIVAVLGPADRSLAMALPTPLFPAYVYCIEPGKLLMFMRTGLGRIFQAWSHDDGETWMRPQPTSLAASTTPAQIRTLPNGHLLAVWNQMSQEEVIQGLSRTRLSAAISRNGSSVWEFFQNVESIHEETRVGAAHITPSTNYGRWTYPSVLVMSDRVIIEYWYWEQDEHPTRAELRLKTREKMKVLPMTWFYGGKEPADNPSLPRASYRPTWG